MQSKNDLNKFCLGLFKKFDYFSMVLINSFVEKNKCSKNLSYYRLNKAQLILSLNIEGFDNLSLLSLKNKISSMKKKYRRKVFKLTLI